jgi:hypothetical protein
MRVCQFRHDGLCRHFGKKWLGATIPDGPPSRKGLLSIFYRGVAACQTIAGQMGKSKLALWNSFNENVLPMETSRELPNDTTSRLRMLSHDLSNSLETILQASYLLGKVKLDGDSKQWVDFIDTASQEAARINREIREVLRAQK